MLTSNQPGSHFQRINVHVHCFFFFQKDTSRLNAQIQLFIQFKLLEFFFLNVYRLCQRAKSPCFMMCNFLYFLCLTYYYPNLRKLENVSYAVIWVRLSQAMRHIPNHILIKKCRISFCLLLSHSSLFTHKC